MVLVLRSGWFLNSLLALGLLFSMPAFAGDEGFIGSSVCAECHQDETILWQGSHHDLAMQPATPETVLGDFDNARFEHFGVISTFSRDGDRFRVRTDGIDGSLQDFEISYAFGVYPLQQYLVEMPGGWLQALGIAWDSRPAEQGGQRWFHLYPEERVDFEDPLHWTQPSQNWNTMCAECHSTRLRKNYDPQTRSFETTWSEIDVACEACHGPGIDHVAWAKREDGWEGFEQGRGLAVQLDERAGVHWKIAPGETIARRSQARESAREIETCARCHSRRSPISKAFRHGESLFDHYLPALLRDGLYFADGQINDEVYVYGSYLQSKMNAAGVTCSDCHEPHSLELRAPGNGVCLQCHLAEQYETEKHHFHELGTIGASCAECHMPTRNYMVVDPRHDHSMRVPRPDLTLLSGTPNACNVCHDDESAAWSVLQVESWYGETPRGHQAYAEILAAARDGSGSGRDLAALAMNRQQPAIARATALSELGPYLSESSVQALQLGLADADPAVRAAAVGTLQSTPPQLRVPLAFPLLRDPIRVVRLEAARVLADVPVGDLPAEQRRQLRAAGQEYVDAQLANAERPEAQTSLGNYYAGQGEREPAIRAYRTAIEIAPYYLPAYVNLADFYRRLGMDLEAIELLQVAVEELPESAAAHHALGLALVRMQRYPQALEALRQANRLEPADANLAYVYAVALNSLGDPEIAIEVLKQTLDRHPRDRQVLTALVSFLRDKGDIEGAQRYAERLRSLP